MSEPVDGRGTRAVLLGSSGSRGTRGGWRLRRARASGVIHDLAGYLFRNVLIHESPTRLRVAWRHPLAFLVAPILLAARAIIRLAVLPAVRLKRVVASLSSKRELQRGK